MSVLDFSSMIRITGRIKALAALAIVTIELIFLYLLSQGNKYIDAFLPNLIAGFTGSFITIFVIDQLLTTEKTRIDKKYSLMAEKRIAMHIKRIQHTFGEMIKSVVNTEDLIGVTTYQELFVEDSVRELRYFDFKKEPPELRYATWMDYVPAVLKEAEDNCTQIINSYFTVLDPDLVEAIDKLFSSPVYTCTKNVNKIIPATEAFSPPIKGFVGYRLPSVMLMETFNGLYDITVRLQALNPKISFSLDANLLSPVVAPAPGSCRLPVDD